MPLWDVKSSRYPGEYFGSVFPPEVVLFDYDGPSIFVFRDQRGTRILAYYACDDDETTNRYIAAPTTCCSAPTGARPFTANRPTGVVVQRETRLQG